MDALECLYTRRSVRKFLDTPIEMEKIGQILEAARLAPSAGNLQNWGFIMVRDKGNRQAVAEACLRQMWMAQAPLQIVVCAVPEKGIKFYGIRGERLYNIQNCAAAAQNILLAAHALGLGACWVSAFEEDMLSRACGIPPEARPQAVIAIGYSAEKPEGPSKHILEKMAFLEGYGSRIKDIDLLIGYPSKVVRKAVDQAKEVISKMHKKLKKE